MKGIKVILLATLALVLIAGCASSRSGKSYTRDQARKTQTVQMGTVQGVEPVQIEGTKTPLGVIAGGALGGVLGGSIGHGWGSVIAGTAGAVAGGMAGGAVEEEVTKKDGIEITVKMDTGKTVAIVQEADETFRVGDRVRILTGPDGTARVRH
ncbi:MAG: hypothetical protein JRL30_14555 [Deltaproteobacteria bacterium]|jgi:outer membrane lipoprotein SlyB|nr:hypothetical protein [Deltaproteobacteria bacterium]